MVVCPKCGCEIAEPKKSWKMACKPDKAGIKTELTIGLYYCGKCKTSFKKALNKKRVSEENEDTEEGKIVKKTLELRERFNMEEIKHIKNSLKKK